MSEIAKTPAPPYYAVIFTNTTTDNTEGYEEMAEQMVQLGRQQPGFLGIESARNEIGITVSYWRDLDSIKQWKQHAEHLRAQKNGRRQWYASYTTRIALVERDYSFDQLENLPRKNGCCTTATRGCSAAAEGARLAGVFLYHQFVDYINDRVIATGNRTTGQVLTVNQNRWYASHA